MISTSSPPNIKNTTYFSNNYDKKKKTRKNRENFNLLVSICTMAILSKIKDFKQNKENLVSMESSYGVPSRFIPNFVLIACVNQKTKICRAY